MAETDSSIRPQEFKPKRDADDPSSTSEAEESDANVEEGEPSVYYCRHCFTTDSKDWHHAGKFSSISLLYNNNNQISS
jgi:arginine-glutamic acid dipeptide repeat-containing protein